MQRKNVFKLWDDAMSSLFEGPSISGSHSLVHNHNSLSYAYKRGANCLQYCGRYERDQTGQILKETNVSLKHNDTIEQAQNYREPTNQMIIVVFEKGWMWTFICRHFQSRIVERL